ncbi:MAG: tRNA (guanosine(37)-N1)-methyltransferase TrmD [Candidatus Spechtbacteria bacterium SB0662_bin_43]|uniref:tRNA (guanine-N(1)-)-methyltransferase n=1 Tax=Candidatus Spechtbacteria bacterium SB0662_bin_43 TaxID=2604897 RepID=A0A845DIR0_9BACT|nr:tRNA (guanosine(37)-N1)-methyltransferase TrmD [Candidatus Spechtbacteria bacterium SB0662_bin_43]
MQFDIFTLFPDIIDSYKGESIIRRAIDAGVLRVHSHNIRDWAHDKHSTVDNVPYGGGAGMVMKVEPIYRAICDCSLFEIKTTERGLVHSDKQRIILLSAKGERFTQQKAQELAQYEHIMLICGRYEGVDERVTTYIADEEISIGEYVLTGGEIPALVLLDAVARLHKGVLGNVESLKEESFTTGHPKEYPHYTRPAVFSPKPGVEWKTPDILLSGNHQEIQKWRQQDSR